MEKIAKNKAKHVNKMLHDHDDESSAEDKKPPAKKKHKSDGLKKKKFTILNCDSSVEDQEKPSATNKHKMDDLSEDSSDENQIRPPAKKKVKVGGKARKRLSTLTEESSQEDGDVQAEQRITRLRSQTARQNEIQPGKENYNTAPIDEEIEKHSDPEHTSIGRIHLTDIATLTDLHEFDIEAKENTAREIESRFQFLYEYIGSPCVDDAVEALNGLLTWLHFESDRKFTIESFNPKK
jgi:hypothetical protein